MKDKELVSECDGAGDVLYQMIMDGKFGYKLSPLINIRWRKRDIILSAFKGRAFPKPIKKVIGHEILFRPTVGSEKQLPGHCIGSAFGQMTANGQQMLEAYPALLEEQLKVVNKYPNKKALIWSILFGQMTMLPTRCFNSFMIMGMQSYVSKSKKTA